MFKPMIYIVLAAVILTADLFSSSELFPNIHGIGVGFLIFGIALWAIGNDDSDDDDDDDGERVEGDGEENIIDFTARVNAKL